MKSRVLWLGFASMLVHATVYALSPGIEAYREGNYFSAHTALAPDANRDASADYYLARMYLYGYGELKNDSLALRYLKQSADRGYLPAMRLLARVALMKEHDAVQALYWFKKAADANDLSAQLYCAAAFHVGLGTAVSQDLSRRYLIMAAKAGNARAQYALAEHFLAAKDAASQRLGVMWLNKALEKQYVPAALTLSELYNSGHAVARDAEKAQNLFDWATARHAKEEKTPAIAETQSPEEAAARWLTDNRTSSLAACGYDLYGIMRAWQNPQNTAENEYNQPPQLAHLTRDALFNPHFEMMSPNHVALIDYYHAYIESVAVPQTTVDFPQYPVTLNQVNLQLIQKAVLGDPKVQFQLGQAYQMGVGVDKNIVL